jgi:uncharacterized protein YcnI
VGVVACGVAATVLVVAGPAAAHVTVNPSDASQGDFTKLTFRVPNEKDGATTTMLEVDLPANQPIASVSVKPTTGWTATATTTKLATPIKSDDGTDVTEAVSKIVWKANSPDAAIQAGQFQEFDVSAGPLPKTDKLVFKALQTYSDGEVVRWIEEPGADGKEPEHPAPTLKLSAAAAAAQPGSAAQASTAPAVATSETSSSNGPALVVGIVALIAALAALAMSLLGRRRGGPATAAGQHTDRVGPAAESQRPDRVARG